MGAADELIEDSHLLGLFFCKLKNIVFGYFFDRGGGGVMFFTNALTSRNRVSEYLQ